MFHVCAAYIENGCNNTFNLRLTKLLEQYRVFSIKHCSTMVCGLSCMPYIKNSIANYHMTSISNMKLSLEISKQQQKNLVSIIWIPRHRYLHIQINERYIYLHRTLSRYSMMHAYTQRYPIHIHISKYIYSGNFYTQGYFNCMHVDLSICIRKCTHTYNYVYKQIY